MFTRLRSNLSLARAAAGTAYSGVKDAWSSGLRGTSASPLTGNSFRSLLSGTWAKNGKWAAAGGAGAGAVGGAMAGGEDNRISGAVAGGLLGAGTGLSGAAAYNNRRGALNLAKAARSGFRRGWNNLDGALDDLRYKS